jgi:hypothetical protein
MTTATNNRFITVSTDADSWGTNDEGFDHVAEARRIRDAAESAGVPVAFDKPSSPLRQNADGTENSEIEWFDVWCREGHAWTDEQWVEWFTRYAPQKTTIAIQFAGYGPVTISVPFASDEDNLLSNVDIEEANEIIAAALMGDVNDDGWIDVIAGNESFQIRPASDCSDPLDWANATVTITPGSSSEEPAQ